MNRYISTIGALFRLVWRSVVALSSLIGIIYLYADIRDLLKTYPWLKGIELPERETILIWFSGLLVLYIVWMDARPFIRKWLASKRKPREIEFDAGQQQKLVDALKRHSDQQQNVKILFATLKYKKLTETLISIFNLAGWQTNMNNLPQEQYTHEYWEGVSVSGYNEHLVQYVSDALKKAGLKQILSNVDENKIKKDNPKWQSVDQYIKIKIGHH